MAKLKDMTLEELIKKRREAYIELDKAFGMHKKDTFQHVKRIEKEISRRKHERR